MSRSQGLTDFGQSLLLTPPERHFVSSSRNQIILLTNNVLPTTIGIQPQRFHDRIQSLQGINVPLHRFFSHIHTAPTGHFYIIRPAMKIFDFQNIFHVTPRKYFFACSHIQYSYFTTYKQSFQFFLSISLKVTYF